jgi:hypothetical protein
VNELDDCVCVQAGAEPVKPAGHGVGGSTTFPGAPGPPPAPPPHATKTLALKNSTNAMSTPERNPCNGILEGW